MPKAKEEQSRKVCFPSEGWDEIERERRERGTQRSTREGGGCSNNHRAATTALTFPAEEEGAEQQEEGRFLLHILPVNSNFTDAFRPARSQPEICLPVPCAGSGGAHMERQK